MSLITVHGLVELHNAKNGMVAIVARREKGGDAVQVGAERHMELALGIAERLQAPEKRISAIEDSTLAGGGFPDWGQSAPAGGAMPESCGHDSQTTGSALFQMGVAAHIAGTPVADNPMNAGSRAWDAWRAGWVAAQARSPATG